MAHGIFYTTEKIGPKQSLTPEGFLLCEEVSLARTGMMIYGPDETPIKAGPDGIVKVFREDDDVFNDVTIASAMGKSVTNDHPEDDVTPESWKELTHGVMMNIRRGEAAMDDLLLGDLLITTPEGIKAVQDGKREVSLGYEADYEETGPGVGRQSNIIINHIALVEQGRCGPRCAISDHKPTPSKGDRNMVAKTKKHSKMLDALMRAFKAKDAEEVEKLAEEVKDADLGSEGGDTHIHVHAGEKSEEKDPDAAATNDDDALAAHIEQNAAEHAEMREMIEQLQEQVAQLSGGTQDAEEAEEEELKKEVVDEVPEELKEEAAKAKDSAYLADSFQDTVAMAEILVPGIRVPTYDRAIKPGKTFKKICGLRRQALDLAYGQPATRGILDDLLGGQPLSTAKMTCDAARTLFRSAAAMKRSINNSGRTNDFSVADTRKAGPMSLAEINRRNAERWGSKK